MAGGVITTGNLPKLNWPGIQGFWGMEYSKHPKVYSRLYTEVASDKAWEEYQGVTGFQLGVQKPQGNPIYFDSQQQGFTTRITNITMALGFIVSFEERMDMQYESVANYRASANAFSMEQAKEQLGAYMFNNAFSSTAFKCADGVQLGSTAHSNVTGSTYANRPTTDAALSETSLEDALISIRGYTDDKGLYVNATVRCLAIPRQLRFTATRILKASGQPDTFSNNPNAIKMLGAVPDMVESIYFTSAGAWFLLVDLGPGGKGMIFQNRMPPEFDRENEWDTKNFKAATVERYAFGIDNPRGVYCNAGP